MAKTEDDGLFGRVIAPVVVLGFAAVTCPIAATLDPAARAEILRGVKPHAEYLARKLATAGLMAVIGPMLPLLLAGEITLEMLGYALVIYDDQVDEK